MSYPKKIELSAEDRKTLEATVRKRKIPAQVSCRARILLMKADGWASAHIAEKLDISTNTVLNCMNRFYEGGIERALMYDGGKGGRRTRITDEAQEWVVSIATSDPSKFKVNRQSWSYDSLTEYICKNAAKAGYPSLETITRSKVYRIISKAGYILHETDDEPALKAQDALAAQDQLPEGYTQIAMQFDEDGNVSIPEEEQ